MTLSHEDANARLLDLVYGEAAPDERAALEAHVAGCAQCTAELAALGATRARVRAALDDGDRHAPVPSRVRANLLAAAHEVVAAAPVVAKASVPVAAAAAPAAKPQAPAPSFWDRLRLKWTLPTFATVGAVAVVLFASKIFLEPQRTMEHGKELVGASTPVAAPPAVPQENHAEHKKMAPVEAPAPPPIGGTLRDHIARAKRGSGGLGVTAGGSGSPLEGLGSLKSWGRGAGAGAASPKPASANRLKADDTLDELGGADDSTSEKRREARPADEPAAQASREGYAQPPSGWKGGAASNPPAAAKAEAAPQAAEPAPRAAVADRASEGAVPPPAPERAREVAKKKAAPAPVASAAPAKPSAPAAEADEAEAPRRQDGNADKDQKDQKEQKAEASPQATLARRADQLFAAHRWPEAIVAYRDLLRRWPDADLKTRWRERLGQAESAQAASQRAAPAAQ